LAEIGQFFHLWEFVRKKYWIGVKLLDGVKSIFRHVLNGENVLEDVDEKPKKRSVT
jgi:hypothetical protein